MKRERLLELLSNEKHTLGGNDRDIGYICELIWDYKPQGRPPDDKYDEYLNGTHWLDLRKEALSKFPECGVCRCERELEVHHTRYTTLGKEYIDYDVTVICRDCHMLIHEMYDKHIRKPLTPHGNAFLDTNKRFTRGKYKGEHVSIVAMQERDYLNYIYGNTKSDYDRKVLNRYR